MDKLILGYLISGGKYLRKLEREDEAFLERVFEVGREIIRQVEEERDTKLSQKQKDRIILLLLGILKKHGEYDERYHGYLIGKLIT